MKPALADLPLEASSTSPNVAVLVVMASLGVRQAVVWSSHHWCDRNNDHYNNVLHHLITTCEEQSRRCSCGVWSRVSTHTTIQVGVYLDVSLVTYGVVSTRNTNTLDTINMVVCVGEVE